MGDFIDKIPPVQFKSDGCSAGLSYLWKLVFNTIPKFEPCCNQHDQLYHFGGNWKDRLSADWFLLTCFWDMKYHMLGVIVFILVRIFGNPNLIKNIINIGWKWNWGWET